jgi:HAE1 family hydrophobic/amphiphilic exporter-1
MVISLFSPKDAYDANFLINYCGINLRDQILRIPGIAQVDLFGGLTTACVFGSNQTGLRN